MTMVAAAAAALATALDWSLPASLGARGPSPLVRMPRAALQLHNECLRLLTPASQDALGRSHAGRRERARAPQQPWPPPRPPPQFIKTPEGGLQSDGPISSGCLKQATASRPRAGSSEVVEGSSHKRNVATRGQAAPLGVPGAPRRGGSHMYRAICLAPARLGPTVGRTWPGKGKRGWGHAWPGGRGEAA